MPAAVLQGHGENVHDRMIQRFSAGVRIEFLRIGSARADHAVRVVARVNDYLFDLREVRNLLSHPKGEIN
jgi:hypothetical protein